jgi:hypothetical protein
MFQPVNYILVALDKRWELDSSRARSMAIAK